MKFKEKQIPAIPVQACPKNSEHCNVQNLQLSAKKFLHVQWLEEKGRHRQKYKTRVKTNPTCLVIKSTGFGNDIIKSMQSGNEINRFRRLHPKAWKLNPFGNEILGNKIRKRMNRILVQFCCSLSNSVVSFGCRASLCVLILNWSNNRKYVLGKNRLCSSKKNWLRFWWKIGSVFGKQVRLWGNQSPIWGNQPLTLEKKKFHFWEKPVRSLGQTGFGFGKKTARFGGKLVWFLDWLGTKLKSHCFERLACLGLDLGI